MPFKANRTAAGVVGEGDEAYVLCAGRSRRDIATFSRAMAMTGLPAVVVQQPAQILREHGTEPWPQRDLPANVRLVTDGDNQLEHLLAKAQLVVIPRFKDDINATGISLGLSAMIYGKCVVVSRGPGADDVLLSGEAAFVEPEDPEALAATIASLHADDATRAAIASRGLADARSLGVKSGFFRTCSRPGSDLFGKALRVGCRRALQPSKDLPIASGAGVRPNEVAELGLLGELPFHHGAAGLAHLALSRRIHGPP